MHTYTPLISIVIRNRNGAEHLQYVFDALKRQEYKFYEIILVDNESTDESVKLAKKAGVKLISIKDFTYGKALNLGISATQGELIVILSSHSIPLGHYFLNECARAFADTNVGAARLVYVGKEADTPRLLNTEVLNNPNEDFISKGPLASGCVIRRTVWQEVPFDEEAIAAEEKIWTAEILKRGYTVRSPVPAFYYYRKQLDIISELYKNYREVTAIYKKFGIRIGFVERGGYQIIVDFVYGIGSVLWIVVEKIHYETVRAYLRLRFPNK